MMLRYSIRRNCSAVCSPIAVSIASFMLLKIGAASSAGPSAADERAIGLGEFHQLLELPPIDEIANLIDDGIRDEHRSPIADEALNDERQADDRKDAGS